MSKNEGGKYISNWQRIMVTSFSKSSNFWGSMTLRQIALKKKHKRVMATQTLSGKTPWMATRKSYYINMWQSWDFKPTNLRSFTDTRLLIFEEYPCGIVTLHKHWQKLFFSFVDIVWQPEGKYVNQPCDIRCNYWRIPMSTKSWWHFKSSFVLPLMLTRVLIKLSQTFSSTCITPIQCLTSRSNQYER